MLKKLTLSTIVLSALLLNGCGGGSSTKADSIKEQLEKRDYIAIFHEYPAAVCTSQRLKDELAKKGFSAIITSVEDNSVSCGYYGRRNGGASCSEELLGGYPNACVIGANGSFNAPQKDFGLSTLSDAGLNTL